MGNRIRSQSAWAVGPLLLSALLLAGCAGEPTALSPEEEVAEEPGACRLDLEYLFDTGLRRDAIPALSQPMLLAADHPEIQRFLSPEDRLVGLIFGDAAYAVPHNVLWYHEIANVTLDTPGGTVDIAATYCPLTGSALVFDRSPVDGAEFGVSGLLYKSNLIMYDRRTETSLWPQMLSEARCGPASGTILPRMAATEMTWAGWRTLYPHTRVLGGIDVDGPYDVYPYGNYEQEAEFDWPMPYIDPRIPQKERVLGVRAADGDAMVFPFRNLDDDGAWSAIPFTLGGAQAPAVVFWDAERRSAMAFWTRPAGQTMTFRALDDGIEDVETGSRWTVDGLAVSGPLEGSRLDPVSEAFVAFWGAWYAFFPQSEIWGRAKPVRVSSP